jgi:hypothetical protein
MVKVVVQPSPTNAQAVPALMVCAAILDATKDANPVFNSLPDKRMEPVLPCKMVLILMAIARMKAPPAAEKMVLATVQGLVGCTLKARLVRKVRARPGWKPKPIPATVPEIVPTTVPKLVLPLPVMDRFVDPVVRPIRSAQVINIVQEHPALPNKLLERRARQVTNAPQVIAWMACVATRPAQDSARLAVAQRRAEVPMVRAAVLSMVRIQTMSVPTKAQQTAVRMARATVQERVACMDQPPHAQLVRVLEQSKRFPKRAAQAEHVQGEVPKTALLTNAALQSAKRRVQAIWIA